MTGLVIDNNQPLEYYRGFMNLLTRSRAGLPLVCLLLAVCVDCASILYPQLPHRPFILIALQLSLFLPSVLWFWKTSHRTESCLSRASVLPPDTSRSVTLIVLIVLVTIVGSGAWLGHEILPGAISPDEIAYRFESSLLASGLVRADPLPDIRPSAPRPSEVRFTHDVATPTGWCAIYPILWPLVLTVLGLKGNAIWAVNPLLGLLLLLLVWKLAVRLFDPQVAMLSLFLLAACPFFLSMLVSTMSHLLAACLITGSMLSLQVWVERKEIVYLSLGVALVGLCLFARPFTALAASAALGGVLLWQSRGFERRLRIVLIVLPIAVVVFALYLLQNRLQTGHYMTSAYAAKTDTAWPPELTLDLRKIAASAPRKVLDGCLSTMAYSGPFVLIAAAYAWVKPSIPRAATALLFWTFVAEVLLYFFDVVPGGWPFGERMYFEGLPGITIVAAAAGVDLARRWKVSGKALIATVVAVVAVQFAQCATAFTALRDAASPSKTFIQFLLNLPIQDAIVFMKSEKVAKNSWEEPWNLNVNDAHWRQANKIFLIDPGPAERARVAHIFNRPRIAVATYNGELHKAIWRELPLTGE